MTQSHTRSLCVIAALAALLIGAGVEPAMAGAVKLSPIGAYSTGTFDESAAEIPAYDPVTQRLFVTNSTQGVDILNLADPTAFPNASDLLKDENPGRLRFTDQLGDTDGDGDFDELYVYGCRSISGRRACCTSMRWTARRAGSCWW